MLPTEIIEFRIYL